ncbi:MAG: tetratricopeptide repeat protein [Proteobacteria bacterium]|nr:tetratricopeptide repeat protein [Pseudomonadota bacterium]
MSGEYEKAIECFDRAIELDPNDAIGYYNRGLTYCYLKQYERGIENFDIAIELDSNYIAAYDNRELAREKLKEQKPIQALTPPKEKGVPGFEAVFGIAGLLAVAYLLRRRG